MRQLRPETGESLDIFFKTLIQLYLFYLFFNILLTVSKRVSKSIFLDITFKSVGIWGSYSLKQGNPLHFFSKHWSNCICFVYFSIFDLLYQRGYQMQYFWTLPLKVLAYESDTAWFRDIPLQNLKFSNHVIFCST